MQQQCRAFNSLPQKWKQTLNTSPDVHQSSFSPHRTQLTPATTPVNQHLSRSSQSSPLLPPCHRPLPSPSPLHGRLWSLWVFLAFLCLLPYPAQAAWFRVGVVGPWGCDPLFAKALPNVAAQLAVNRINRDPSLSYAATFDYAVLQVELIFNLPKKV